MRIDPRYFFYEAFMSLRKNFVMTFIAIIQVAIALLMVGSLAFVAYDSRQIIKAVEREVEISVYLEDGINNEVLHKYENKIKSWSEVENIEYRSKEEAIKIFKAQLPEDSNVFEVLDPEILPASFEISLKDPQKVGDVVKRFKDEKLYDLGPNKYWKWINDMEYGESYIQNFFRVTNTIRILTFLVISLLFISSIILIYNTIRLSIIARRKEIEVIKLVGASNWYVRWPFIIEGVVQGIIGALIAIGLVFIINISFIKRLENAFNRLLPLPLNFAVTAGNPIQLKIFLTLFIIGILVGALGSVVALGKFIKI